MAPSKKPRVAPPNALSPTLLGGVLPFVAAEDCLVHLGDAGFKLDVEELRSLSLVSKAWYGVASEAASARLLHVVYVRFKPPVKQSRRRKPKPERRRSDMLALRNQLILRRAHTKRLVIDELLDYDAIGLGVWEAALSHTPHLQILELATATSWDIEAPPTDRLVDVVHAATRHCPSLEKLAISGSLRPPTQEQEPREGKHMQELLEAVFEGLKAWSSQSGGLRDLKLPLHSISRDAKPYMDNVLMYCRQIRAHRLFTAPRFEFPRMMCAIRGEDAWKLDLHTWERFCRVCNDLEELDWHHLPFATHFFEVFGCHRKPNLRSLTLAATGQWMWDEYFKVVDTETQTAVQATGFGASAKHPESIFRATSNLVELTVDCSNSSSKDGAAAMDCTVFGDDFIEEMTRCCKNLGRVTYTVDWHTSLEPISTFTDRSLRALGSLPHLEEVNVIGVNVTGDGLFEMFTNHRATTRQHRKFSLRLGERKETEPTNSMICYDALEGFLKRLASYDDTLPCESRLVSLRLFNRNFADLEPNRSASWLDKVRHLAQQVRARHPALQLRGFVHGYDSESGVITRMSEFQFATKLVALSTLKDPQQDPEIVDIPIDDVFMHQIFPRFLGDSSDSD